MTFLIDTSVEVRAVNMLRGMFREKAQDKSPTGFIQHQVKHPHFGIVDDIWVRADESADELAALDRAVFERLGITIPEVIASAE
jgi:hypothetical protein